MNLKVTLNKSILDLSEDCRKLLLHFLHFRHPWRSDGEKRGFRLPHIFNDLIVIENGSASLHCVKGKGRCPFLFLCTGMYCMPLVPGACKRQCTWTYCMPLVPGANKRRCRGGRLLKPGSDA